MSKIIKYYLDIGCIYEGDSGTEYIYNDHQNWSMKDYGLIGILKLKIDTKKKTKEEIFLRQTFSPYIHEFAKNLISDFIWSENNKDIDKDILGTFREYRDADLIVGWNSRDFDIPIILNNLGWTEEHINRCFNKIIKKDRDLLDLCLLREINVRGGLQQVIKRLKIGHLPYKCCPDYTDEELHFLTDFDRDTNIHNNSLRIARHKNEFDIRILPLLEEKLGYLYEQRSPVDKYHKKW